MKEKKLPTMKIKSILSKDKNKKKYMFYCYECNNKQMLLMGRHWCTCATPEFQMGTSTPKELDQQGKAISAFFRTT